AGWHCTQDANCESPFTCTTGILFLNASYCIGGRCVMSVCSGPPSDPCQNGVRDGEETDVDCGGNLCLGGGYGQRCNRSLDCRSGYACIGGLCLAPSCTPGVCGAGCVFCANGQPCAVSADCVSQVCDPSSHTCAAPTCSDHVMNGNETGVDCGGSCP